MSNVVPSLEQFFESLLTTLHEAIEGLNCEYESNRAESLASRLGDFEGTLGLIASRLAQRGCCDRLLEDVEHISSAVRVLQANYRSRQVPPGQGNGDAQLHYNCPVERTGQACRPRYAIDKDLVQRLRNESFKWVDSQDTQNFS